MGNAPIDQEAIDDAALMLRALQVSKMIEVAAALGLPDRVAEGGKPTAELAVECGVNPGMLLRLCRALAAFGFFEVDSNGKLVQTPRSACLRTDTDPTLHYAARFASMPSNWAAWGNLDHTIRTGEPAFEATHKKPFFAFLAANPADEARFYAFMEHSPDDRHRAVVEACDFSSTRLVVDVGGGKGALSAAILASNPQARALLFDRDEVVSDTGAILGYLGERCTAVAGDFLETVPTGGDTYVLCQILHNWNDALCGRILANCREAMIEGARLMVIERLLDNSATRADPMNFLSDIQMMVLFPDARERTAAEYDELVQAAGFSPLRVTPTRSPFAVLQAAAV